MNGANYWPIFLISWNAWVIESNMKLSYVFVQQQWRIDLWDNIHVHD